MTAADRVLILFLGAPGGNPPGAGLALPADCEITLDRRRLAEADAVVFHGPSLGRWRWRPRRRRGQIWVLSSMESVVNYPRLGDPRVLRWFDLTMTYRLDSDIPAPYVDYYASADNLARALREPPRPRTEPAPAVSLISSPYDRSGRQAYVAELARYIPVHSYGAFMRTHRLVLDGGRPTKLDTIARYAFTLAFENAVDRDYVTEKFFDPLVAGSVPVYLGAPNVAEFAPGERCFVDVAAFAGPRELAEYLLALLDDADGYASYLAWKARPFRPTFERFLAGQALPPILRLFERVRALRSAGGSRSANAARRRRDDRPFPRHRFLTEDPRVVRQPVPPGGGRAALDALAAALPNHNLQCADGI